VSYRGTPSLGFDGYGSSGGPRSAGSKSAGSESSKTAAYIPVTIQTNMAIFIEGSMWTVVRGVAMLAALLWFKFIVQVNRCINYTVDMFLDRQ
jgi:hypothetical protein